MSEAFDPSMFLPRPDVSDINERGADFTRREIAKYCDEIVDIVWSGVNASLEADKEITERLNVMFDQQDGRPPKGEIFGVFVQQDTAFTAPMEDGQPMTTFCTKLEPIVKGDVSEFEDETDELASELESEPLKDSDKRYMKIHVPAGELIIHDFVMPSPKDVDRVFIETGDDEDVRWYSVERNGTIMEYVPELYQDTERNEGLMVREWEKIMKDGVPVVHQTVTDLLQHIVDWKTVPQRIRTVQ